MNCFSNRGQIVPYGNGHAHTSMFYAGGLGGRSLLPIIQIQKEEEHQFCYN